MTSLFASAISSTMNKVDKDLENHAAKQVKSHTVLQVEQEGGVKILAAKTFQNLQLCEWICQSAYSMGFKRPTAIQEICIPAILKGRDIIGNTCRCCFLQL